MWTPGIPHGLLQTPDYARVYIEKQPDVTPEVVEARLTARVERQKRILFRDDPPEVWFVIDHTALYRLAGSPEITAAQMRHLLELARLPHVTVQVLPAVAHPTPPRPAS